MDDLDILKIAITVGIFLGILLICTVCYFILDCIAKRYQKEDTGKRKHRHIKVFSHLNLFSGGVFFATSFLHLLPEAKDEMKKFLDLATISLEFPLCEFIVCFGFFMVLFIEQLTSKLHKIYDIRRESLSLLKSKQIPAMLTLMDLSPNIASVGNKSVEKKGGKKIRYQVDERNVEPPSPGSSENAENKYSNITLNEESCTECVSPSTESIDSCVLELSNNPTYKDEECFCSAKMKDFTSLSNDCTSSSNDSIGKENPSPISDTRIPMKSSNFLGSSSTQETHSKNTQGNDNSVIITTKKLPNCICGLKHLRKYTNNEIPTIDSVSSSSCKKINPPPTVDPCNYPSKLEEYRAIILLISLLFHSLFDGLALGLQTNANKVYAILIAILLHKSLVAFSLTLKFYRAFPNKLKFIFLCLLLFSIISPIGCLIGWYVSGSGSIHIIIRTGSSGILQSLAAGTFFYVTFIEILGPELGHGHSRLISTSFIFLGFISIAFLRFIM